MTKDRHIYKDSAGTWVPRRYEKHGDRWRRFQVFSPVDWLYWFADRIRGYR